MNRPFVGKPDELRSDSVRNVLDHIALETELDGRAISQRVTLSDGEAYTMSSGILLSSIGLGGLLKATGHSPRQ